MHKETRGRKPLHSFDGYELGKPRLYKASKIVNGKPISLTSLHISARNYANKNGLKVYKSIVPSGITLRFEKAV